MTADAQASQTDENLELAPAAGGNSTPSPGPWALVSPSGIGHDERVDSNGVESKPIETRASLFSALSDPTRLRILDLLGSDDTCVCEIQRVVGGVAPNLLSYHLRVLREAGLVESSRRGRWVDYRISDGAVDRIRHMLPVPLTSETAAL